MSELACLREDVARMNNCKSDLPVTNVSSLGAIEPFQSEQTITDSLTFMFTTAEGRP